MIARAALILALLLAFPAQAQWASQLRGHWTITMAADPSFLGAVLIDSEGRITWDGVWDPAYRANHGLTPVAPGHARSRGYVIASAAKAELVLTNSRDVERVHCIVQSSDLMQCSGLTLTKVGQGPVNLMRVSQ